MASGSANPLKYRVMVDNTTAWFREHPLYDAEGQPIVVPDWSFPGRGRVQGQLNRAKTVLTKTEKVLQALPLRGSRRSGRPGWRRSGCEVERALEYVELYGLYAECEAIYGVDHLLALGDALPPEDRAAFCFDPRVIDWPRYIREVHLPSVVEHARVKTTPGKTRDRPGASACAATCSRPTATSPPSTSRTRSSPATWSRATRGWRPAGSTAAERLRFALRTSAEIPGLLALDRKDRGDFLRFFYRRYEDAPVAQLDADAVELLSASSS